MTGSEAEDLARVINVLIARLDRFIGWRRNFTIAVAFLAVLLGLAIWNNNRVQACNQHQIAVRGFYFAQAQNADEQLWLRIEDLIHHPKSNRKAGNAAFTRIIDNFIIAENQVRRHKIGSCSWF